MNGLFDQFIALLQPQAARWAQVKLELGEALGLSTDVLHLHAGMLVLCFAALVLRRSPLDWRPWLVLLVLECANELADLMLEGMGSTEATLGAGLHDLVNTMFAPTLLLLVGRWQRRKS
jgi:hypothetical protein